MTTLALAVEDEPAAADLERLAHGLREHALSFAGEPCFRPLYERLGYRVFATIDDYPPGHQRFFLEKPL